MFLAIGLTSWYMAHDMHNIRERAKADCTAALAAAPRSATGVIDDTSLPKGCHPPGYSKDKAAANGTTTVIPAGGVPATQDPAMAAQAGANDAYAGTAYAETGEQDAYAQDTSVADPYAQTGTESAPQSDPYATEQETNTSGF